MTVEEIREALAADEMSGIARWHMVKTLLAEVDSLRVRCKKLEDDYFAVAAAVSDGSAGVADLCEQARETRARLAAAEKARDAAIDREHDTTERLLAADAALAAAREALSQIANGYYTDAAGYNLTAIAQAALHPATKEGK